MNKKPFIICMAIMACLAVVTGAYSAFGNQFVNIKGEKVSYKTVSAAAASAKSKTPSAASAECSVKQTTTKPTTEKEPQGNNNGTSSSMPYLIKVNKTQNIVIIYKQDDSGEYTVPVKAMVCSVGKEGNTPSGTFKTSDKYTWRLLEGNVYGQYATRITGHFLFHSVPYFEKSKDTLEYDEYNKLGVPASAGCIRLSVEDSKWIYDNCPTKTTVIMYESDKKSRLKSLHRLRLILLTRGNAIGTLLTLIRITHGIIKRRGRSQPVELYNAVQSQINKKEMRRSDNIRALFCAAFACVFFCL